MEYPVKAPLKHGPPTWWRVNGRGLTASLEDDPNASIDPQKPMCMAQETAKGSTQT